MNMLNRLNRLSTLDPRELELFFRPTFDIDFKVERYPLTNLAIDNDENLIIEIAIAGFKKDDIEIERRGNQLLITGEASKEESEGLRYIQRMISPNPFQRIVKLHDNYVDGSTKAKVEDGILTVTVEPKEQLKKVIDIE